MPQLNPPNLKISPVVHDDTIPLSVPPDGTEWRCPACKKDLFGIFKGGQLHIRYRERDIFVQGVVRVGCRRCGVETTIDTRRVRINLVQSLGDRADALTVSVKFEATRAAKELADKLGIDLSTIMGTGKDGRITRQDVELLTPSP